MKKTTWPKHLGETKQQWQSRKRRELDVVLWRIEDELAVGSAYLPDYEAFRMALASLRKLREAMQTRRWR